ncbi:MAG TPA: SAM-dependent chlorinase/fluorinase [bacterium]|nr:SAM-dependent chlorinase/fluorinase [bacterium]
MSRAAQILTLTTDFGTADGYVGAMKGRILSIAPETLLCDIAHDIPPQDVARGAWCLRRSVSQFPWGTVHLAVVDPGVGSQRAGIVIESEHYLFVGPDNGLLHLAARDDGIRRVIEISEDAQEWYKSTSFDGLTLFAPVAALLVAGMPLEEVGPDAEELVEWSDATAVLHGNVVEGRIVLFDRFGNAITDIPGDVIGDRSVERIYLRNSQELRYCDHYAQLAGDSRPGALINSDGRLELTVYGDSAQARLSLKAGDAVRVLLRPL